MNHKLALAIFLSSLSPLVAAADGDAVNACELLQVENLAPWGYTSPLLTDSRTLVYKKDEIKAPSEMHTSLCYLTNESAEKRRVAFVTVESFAKDVNAEAVAAWLEAESDKADGPDMKFEKQRVGDANCETGEYAIPETGGAVAIQHYAACDRMVGTHHLIINLQHPDTAKLPTLLQVKELLDQAGGRLVAPAKSI